MPNYKGNNYSCYIPSLQNLVTAAGNLQATAKDQQEKGRIWIPGGYVKEGYGWPEGEGAGPIHNYVSAPYVTVKFVSGEGGTLTVGNESSPEFENHAVIKSFEYSVQPGCQAKIEVLDEEGGVFSKFFMAMMRCIKSSADARHKIHVKFGWVFRDCENNVSTWPCGCGGSTPGDPCGNNCPLTLVFYIMDMDVSYTQGKIKYTITANDLMSPIFMARSLTSRGSDKDSNMALCLKDAIRELFNEQPKVEVKWGRYDHGKVIINDDPNFSLKAGDRCGPKDKFNSDGQNKLATWSRWIEKYHTEDKKGWTPTWNVCNEKAQIIFWQDPWPHCEGDFDDARSIGTFIVNGGKCSSVLDFSPKFNFIVGAAQLPGSGGVFATGQVRSETKKDEMKPDCPQTPGAKNKCCGGLGIMPLPSSDWEKTTIKLSEAHTANRKANSTWEGVKSITAEMRITGNPSAYFVSNPSIVGRTCSIIAINPFHIGNQSGRKEGESFDCGKYLTHGEDLINPILTSKKWVIKQVSHSIREGNYITTVQVFLDVPGIELGLLNKGNSNVQQQDAIAAAGQAYDAATQNAAAEVDKPCEELK